MSMRSDRARRRAARRRNQRIFLGLGLVIVLAVAAFLAFTALNQPDNGGGASPAETVTPTGLRIQELEQGTGRAATVGDTVLVHYTGWLEDGTQFDSSLDSGQPLPVTLGQGSVIRGWEEGLLGMQAGGKRKLIIPPDLAYGAQGYPGAIPPNATLTFDVELVSFQ